MNREDITMGLGMFDGYIRMMAKAVIVTIIASVVIGVVVGRYLPILFRHIHVSWR